MFIASKASMDKQKTDYEESYFLLSYLSKKANS